MGLMRYDWEDFMPSDGESSEAEEPSEDEEVTENATDNFGVVLGSYTCDRCGIQIFSGTVKTTCWTCTQEVPQPTSASSPLTRPFKVREFQFSTDAVRFGIESSGAQNASEQCDRVQQPQ